MLRGGAAPSRRGSTPHADARAGHRAARRRRARRARSASIIVAATCTMCARPRPPGARRSRWRARYRRSRGSRRGRRSSASPERTDTAPRTATARPSRPRLRARRSRRRPSTSAPPSHRAGGIQSGEGQRVRMARRFGGEVEHDVGLGIEGDLACAGQRQPVRLARAGDDRDGGVGIDRRGLRAGEAEDHGAVGLVPAPGPGERAEQPHPQARDLRACGRARCERGGRLHRPDRVRGRRSDADLEQV